MHQIISYKGLILNDSNKLLLIYGHAYFSYLSIENLNIIEKILCKIECVWNSLNRPIDYNMVFLWM